MKIYIVGPTIEYIEEIAVHMKALHPEAEIVCDRPRNDIFRPEYLIIDAKDTDFDKEGK